MDTGGTILGGMDVKKNTVNTVLFKKIGLITIILHLITSIQRPNISNPDESARNEQGSGKTGSSIVNYVLLKMFIF
jgi:hypothetical protein